MNRPNGSAPVLVITAARRPYLAAATATFVGLPPRNFPKDDDVLQADADLLRVDVDAHPAHRDDVVRLAVGLFRLGRGHRHTSL